MVLVATLQNIGSLPGNVKKPEPASSALHQKRGGLRGTRKVNPLGSNTGNVELLASFNFRESTPRTHSRLGEILRRQCLNLTLFSYIPRRSKYPRKRTPAMHASRSTSTLPPIPFSHCTQYSMTQRNHPSKLPNTFFLEYSLPPLLGEGFTPFKSAPPQ
jgi:hypothetical protein